MVIGTTELSYCLKKSSTAAAGGPATFWAQQHLPHSKRKHRSRWETNVLDMTAPVVFNTGDWIVQTSTGHRGVVLGSARDGCDGTRGTLDVLLFSSVQGDVTQMRPSELQPRPLRRGKLVAFIDAERGKIWKAESKALKPEQGVAPKLQNSTPPAHRMLSREDMALLNAIEIEIPQKSDRYSIVS